MLKEVGWIRSRSGMAPRGLSGALAGLHKSLVQEVF